MRQILGLRQNRQRVQRYRPRCWLTVLGSRVWRSSSQRLAEHPDLRGSASVTILRQAQAAGSNLVRQAKRLALSLMTCDAATLFRIFSASA